MRNKQSIQAVEESRFSSSFVKPLYHSYCFSRIPATISQLLLGKSTHPLPVDVVGGKWETKEVVILFLIDGFGWTFFEQFASQYPFLQRYQELGVVSRITSQFPSTTAAHITTINSGLEVGQSGVYEWFYYEPLVDQMIAPLLFSVAGDHRPGTLESFQVPPERFFPSQTFYQHLANQGVKSYQVLSHSIAHTPYSKSLARGAEVIGCRSLSHQLETILELAEAPGEGPTYIYAYWGDIDAAGHRHGIDSEAFRQAVAICLTQLETLFWPALQRIQKKVATLVTADHGMVPISPQRTYYLNQEYPALPTLLKKNRRDEPLVPAGSCRDFFLHVEDRHRQEVKKELEQRLAGRAEVYLIEDLIKAGLFGMHAPSETFMSRVGNLVILPYANEAVWWFQKHRFEQHFFAAHGGLTPAEMESIFLFQ